jgi:phosphatidylglycerophosphatase A
VASEHGRDANRAPAAGKKIPPEEAMFKETDTGEGYSARRRRRRPTILLATGFGVGYSRVAPGTLGAALGVALYCAFLPLGALHITIPAVSVALFFAGVHLSFLAEAYFREKDCQKIVFDELASFPLSMALISPTPLRVALAFAFNRVADILKPFPARRIQRLKGGWGVMLDDTVAAVYANLLLRLVILAFHA